MKLISILVYMKKVLDSDWLRAVQLTCNTSTKRVTPVQITTKSSVVYSPKKPGEKTISEGHPRCSENYRSQPEDFQRFPKIFERY